MGRKHQDTHERWRSFHSLFSLSRERKCLRCFLSAPSLHEPSEPLLKQRIPRIQVALSPSKKQSDGLLFTWRRERDSNSRNRCRLDGFQDRSLQPLGHLSVCVATYWITTLFILPQLPPIVERLTGNYCHIYSISARCAKSRNCRLQCCPGCHNIIDH